MITLYTVYEYETGLNSALLQKFWRILLYVTDDAKAKLYVTKILVKCGNWSNI